MITPRRVESFQHAGDTTMTLRRAGRASGIRTDVLPSLEQVERRRFELWLMSTVLLVGPTAGLAIRSL
ncbi:MAG: hypothetical protein KY451_09450 [Actinobacteria bacterium]|nr:hypothetical protein [Actinomycetota bacterium]MBW3647253.1 hypothetical protein [Actinomycetota bacterium]